MAETLAYGAVDLLPSDAASAALGYMVEASADGTQWGNPNAIITAVQSRLQDGSLAIVDSYENREATIRIRVTSPTYDGLAVGEAALVAETQRDGYNTLTWCPAVGLAEQSVFDVVYGILAFDFDDLAETRLERYFTLTLSCLPFPRASVAIVASAPPGGGGGTTTVVDACSATTGWTGSPATVSVVSGAVRSSTTTGLIDDCSVFTWLATGVATGSGTTSGYVYAGLGPGGAGGTMGLRRSSLTSPTSRRYKAIDVLTSIQGGGTPTPSFLINGAAATVYMTEAAPRAGYTRYWFNFNSATMTQIEAQITVPTGPGSGINIDNLLDSDTDPANKYVSLLRNSAITGLNTQPFLLIDWAITHSPFTGPWTVEILLDGVASSILDTTPVGSFNRSYVRAPTSTVTTVQIRSVAPYDTGYGSKILDIDQIQKSDQGPAIGTRRQLLRTVDVAGSMRTQGQLSIQAISTTSLGEVLCYTYPNLDVNYSPPLRQWIFAGTTVTDATTVSGATNMLDTMVEWRVPANRIVAGAHRLYARLKGDSTGNVTLNIAAYTRVGTTDVNGTYTTSVTIPVTANYAIYDLTGLALPPALVPELVSVANVRITIVDADTSGIDVTLDEAWLFNIDIGAINHIDCGTGTGAVGGPSKRLWFDPATVTNDGMDAVFIGHTADRTDAFFPGTSVKGWTPPMFEPPTMKILTVTTNALDAAVDLTHYPRYLHNVAA